MEDELLDIVDENDNIIGKDTKNNKFKKGLISRNVVVLIMDKDKRLLIPKRAPDKKTFPNRYDTTVCGNVGLGESNEEAAKREMMEEIGIECELTFLHKIYNEFEYEGHKLRYFTSVFLGHFDGEVNLNEELVDLQKFTVEEIKKMIKENKDAFTPGFVKDFNIIKDKLIL